MGWGLAAYGLMSYLSSKDQANAARESSQPLPTYYQEYQSPQQAQMYGQMLPSIQNMYGGNMPSPTLANMGGAPSYSPVGTGQVPQWGGVQTPQAPSYSPVGTGQVPMPSAGWYNNLDPNIRAGIEEPYMRSMDMMRNQLGGGGMLGNQRAGMSGAAADVYGQYMQQAAPAMAQTAWGMMQPGLLQQQQQQYGAGLQAQQLGAQSGLLAQQQQYGANVLGAQMPWEAGMTQMGQQYGAGLQAQGLGAQAGMQQLGAQNQAALMGQQQGWEGQMFPYQALPSMLPQTYSDLLVGHHPHIGPAGTPYEEPNQGTSSSTHPDAYGHEVPDWYTSPYGYDPWGK